MKRARFARAHPHSKLIQSSTPSSRAIPFTDRACGIEAFPSEKSIASFYASESPICPADASDGFESWLDQGTGAIVFLPAE
ncbi:hypothetical protein HTIA_1725 [Halorhabdus tiamatea SARL4B]|uniref:Uncharacterized protein n=1 Tax=Halorhabdus tiamatea SARL4B TaxID=1033806 RepID=S6D343_9EURY|nr:hypothetical protein HTIA_1725 [Halorhabdus tiamatea SARL4B]